MNRRELEQSWARTRAHLAEAVARLPAQPSGDPDGGALCAYHEYLEHNELELALDELEQLGEMNEVPPEYWQSLARAAAEMGLTEHERRYNAF